MAIYCPACEQVHFHQFSLFELSNSPRAFHCACGFTQAHIAKHNHRYEISLLTAAGDRVRLLFPFRDLVCTFADAVFPWRRRYSRLLRRCRSGGRSRCRFGQRFLEPEDFFAPEVMTRILAYLQKLASNHKIGCTCSNPAVGIDVYPDKVELVCSHCGSAILMSAVSEEDVNRLLSLSELRMKPASYIYLGEWLKPIR